MVDPISPSADTNNGGTKHLIIEGENPFAVTPEGERTGDVFEIEILPGGGTVIRGTLTDGTILRPLHGHRGPEAVE